MYDRYVNGFAESPKHQSLIEHAFPFVSLYFAFELCHSTINSNWHITYVKITQVYHLLHQINLL